MIKTIDIQAKEWFDKANGNSYFSAVVTTDFGTEAEKEFLVPFQYGYGEHYVQMAGETLTEAGVIDKRHQQPLWSYCEENKIILRRNIQTGCKKRDCV